MRFEKASHLSTRKGIGLPASGYARRNRAEARRAMGADNRGMTDAAEGEKREMQHMNIVLVDDHAATRDEIVALLALQDDLAIVGQAANGEEGVRLARQLRPDVIVMDVVMPGMNGIDATAAVRSSVPETRVLALSNHIGEHLIEVLFRAGATGYVRKDRAYEELVPAIRAVARGEHFIGGHVDV